MRHYASPSARPRHRTPGQQHQEASALLVTNLAVSAGQQVYVDVQYQGNGNAWFYSRKSTTKQATTVSEGSGQFSGSSAEWMCEDAFHPKTTQALTLCRSPVLEGSGRMHMIEGVS